MDIPKNIRQVGENNTNNRIYVEDYVITYLRQIKKNTEYGSRAVLLLGHVEEKKEINCYYISGAMVSRKKRIERDEFVFDETDRGYLLEQRKGYFPEMEIIGWAVIESEFDRVFDESAWMKSNDEFDENNKLFCRILIEYDEMKWYLNRNRMIKQIYGYAIFYDQNEKMQNYLIHWHKEKQQQQSITEEVSDQAAKRFRSLVMQRQEYNYGRYASSFFYIICVFLLLVISVMGITTINQYDKMIAVENAMLELAQAMKENESAMPAETMSATQMSLQEKAEEKKEVNVSTNVQEKEQDSPEEMENKKRKSKEGDTNEVETPDEENANEIENQGEESTNEAEEQDEKSADDVEDQGEKSTNEVENQGEKSTYEAENQDGEDTGNMETTDSQIDLRKTEPYCVQAGDTLAGISYRYYQTTQKVSEICKLNEIENPDSIVVGEKILLP